MTQAVVIGIFEGRAVAEDAIQKLALDGFGIDQVDLTFDTPSVLTKIKEYRQLTDEDDEEVKERYENIATHAAVVTVVTNSFEQAERAVEILDNCGALDIDEHARLARSDGESLPYAEERLHINNQGSEKKVERSRSRIVQPPLENTL
jgi:hypothetical protein